jgi:hypothetical protein
VYEGWRRVVECPRAAPEASRVERVVWRGVREGGGEADGGRKSGVDSPTGSQLGSTLKPRRTLTAPLHVTADVTAIMIM